MIICVDVDDTLNNLQEAVMNLFNERHGTSYSVEDFTEFDIANVLPIQDAMAMQQMYAEPGIYNHVSPVAGAQAGLKRLIRDGHEVLLVTASVPSIFKEKVEWIQHFFPFIDKEHIISMIPKWLIRCDVMIEDNFKTLLGGQNYDRICLNRPWNQNSHDWVYGIIRVNNWDDIVDEINKITKESEMS